MGTMLVSHNSVQVGCKYSDVYEVPNMDLRIFMGETSELPISIENSNRIPF